jgi:serine/threonine-protein kinase
VVKFLDTGEADGFLYQAMEMLEGADLGKVMSEGRQFNWEAKLSIMEQVSEGLEYAHAKQLVHRDVKPANLFLENSGRVKVLDFGMVRVAESELTKVGSSLGTLNYMAPEQIRGDRCTAATDVFSAGIVFYQLASGRHPFSTRERSLAQVVSAIVFETPPKLSELCPDAPEGLEFILNRALEKAPARRIHNAGDLKQALGLCRMTMAIASSPSIPAAKPGEADKTRMMPVPPGAAEDDAGKTRVMPRPETAPAAPVALEDEKTRVMQRPGSAPPAAVPAAPVAPKPAAPKVAPPVAPPPVSVTGLRFRYCPACTNPNPPEATVCQRCRTPLSRSGGSVPAAGPKQTQWALYLAIAVAAILAAALIWVLLTK